MTANKVFFGDLELEIPNQIGKKKTTEKIIVKSVVFSDITDPFTIVRALKAYYHDFHHATDLKNKGAKITKIINKKQIGT